MEPINQIDRLTLELLTSRKQYRQYLKHTDTQKYLEQTGFLRKVRKYESAALGVIHELLADPEKAITNEITDTFVPFMQAIFRHLESANAQYNDTLFDQCDEDGDVSAAHSRNMIQYSMQMFMKPNSQTQTQFMQKRKERRFSNPDANPDSVQNHGMENNMSDEYREYRQNGLSHESIYASSEEEEDS
jgi:hypothetical protein